MDKAKQDSLLGIVFFAGLALLLWATYALSDLSFEERPSLEVYADNAGGIREGDPVFVLGNRAGQVGRIERLPNAISRDQRVRLRLDLRSELRLARDAKIELTAANLLGGTIIEIDPGLAPEPWPLDEVVIARVRANGLEALGKLLDDEEVQADFRAIVAGVRSTVDNLNSMDGTLGLLLNSTALHDDFLAATQSARRGLEELERAESPLGRLIYSDEDGQRMSSAIARFESVAQKIDEGEGLVGRIVNDAQLGADAKRLVTDAADIVTDAKNGVGTVGRLLRDDGLADRVESAVESFAQLVENANDPEKGVIGWLVAGTDLREQVARIVDDIEASTEAIRSGNGLLARLIHDEEMGEQLSRVLNQVSRAIEDAREAAPVGTFFQVLSGAF